MRRPAYRSGSRRRIRVASAGRATASMKPSSGMNASTAITKPPTARSAAAAALDAVLDPAQGQAQADADRGCDDRADGQAPADATEHTRERDSEADAQTEKHPHPVDIPHR